MATSINPFKKTAAAPLVEQLAAKQVELEDLTIDKADEAANLAAFAAEAKAESKLASQQASAVDAAYNILTKAGVTL